MQLPTDAVAATVLIEVVRISALPIQRGAPYPGRRSRTGLERKRPKPWPDRDPAQRPTAPLWLFTGLERSRI